MRNIFVRVVAAIGVLLAVAFGGYLIGRKHQECVFESAPLGAYVQDTWHDCRSIRKLNRGETDDVLQDLNMNLNQQIQHLWWISLSAPCQQDRSRASQLLLDIAQNRRDFVLHARDSKAGMWIHSLLDEAMGVQRVLEAEE